MLVSNNGGEEYLPFLIEVQAHPSSDQSYELLLVLADQPENE